MKCLMEAVPGTPRLVYSTTVRVGFPQMFKAKVLNEIFGGLTS